MQNDLEAVKSEKTKMREESKKIETELRQERDKAQEQVSIFTNSSKDENQKLAQSLSQTLEQLNRKEDECEASLNRIKELQTQNEQMAAANRELQA